MMNVILGFGGRLGRLHYFLLSLVLAAFLTVVIFTIGFAAFSRMDRGAIEGGGRQTLTLIILVLTVPIYGWFTLGLMAKRFRDIGWDPFVVIIGWGTLAVIDCVAAGYVPARFVASDGTQTLFGWLLNLGMIGCLLFWPSADDDVTATPVSAPRISRVEALATQGPGGAIKASFGLR